MITLRCAAPIRYILHPYCPRLAAHHPCRTTFSLYSCLNRKSRTGSRPALLLLLLFPFKADDNFTLACLTIMSSDTKTSSLAVPPNRRKPSTNRFRQTNKWNETKTQSAVVFKCVNRGLSMSSSAVSQFKVPAIEILTILKFATVY